MRGAWCTFRGTDVPAHDHTGLDIEGEAVSSGSAPVESASTGTPGFTRGVAALTLTLFAVLALWATLTPGFSTVDEPRHFNSVVRLVQGGGWPEPRTAPMLEATRVATEESGGTDADERGQVPRADRTPVLGLDAPESADPRLDWMTQHPPGYYAISAVAVAGVDALSPGEQRWDQSLLVMRLVSCLMTAAALPFMARSVLLVTGSTAASLVGAASFLLVPQMFNSHSLVTNDAMITLLGSVVTWAGIRAYMRPETLLSSSIYGGVALGVGLLTKGLMLPTVAVLAMYLLVAGRRAGRGWRLRFWIPLVGGVIAFVIGGWWWVRNIVVFGQIQSSNNGAPRAAEPFDGYSFSSFAVQAVARLNRTFWGSIRPPVGYDGQLLAAMGAVALLVVLAAFVWSRHRGLLALTAIYPALVTALFTANAWRIFWNDDFIAGVQGRYLYSGFTFLALAFGLFWQEVSRRMGRMAGIAVAASVMGGTAAAVLGSYVYAFGVQWGGQGAGPGQRYTAMVDASAVPIWFHAAWIGFTALLGLTAAVLVVRAAAFRPAVESVAEPVAA